MKRFYALIGTLTFFMAFSLFAVNLRAQQRETYTGTVLSYGSGFGTRTVTRTFTLNIERRTTDQQAQRYLNLLSEGGQDTMLREIDDQELGRFSIGANVGVPVNVVRESVVNGQRRIFIVFRRWTQFAELRGGYRSLDYPFGVIELFIDERTGRGEGTYIAAAKIRWDRNDKTNQYQIEIENFATYPARLLGVTRRNRQQR